MTRQWPDDRCGLRLSDGFGEGNEAISALVEFEYECVEMSGVKLVRPLGRCACVEEHQVSVEPFALFLLENRLQDIIRGAVVLHGWGSVVGIACCSAREVDQYQSHGICPFGYGGIIMFVGRHEKRRIAQGDAIGSQCLVTAQDILFEEFPCDNGAVGLFPSAVQGMAVTVTTYVMTCFPDAGHILGILLEKGTCEKEGCLDAMTFQCAQNLFHTIILVGSSEDQCELTAGGVCADNASLVHHHMVVLAGKAAGCCKE